MKHYKSVDGLQNLRMSIPPAQTQSHPIEDFLAMILLVTNKGKHYARVIGRGPTQQLDQMRSHDEDCKPQRFSTITGFKPV